MRENSALLLNKYPNTTQVLNVNEEDESVNFFETITSLGWTRSAPLFDRLALKGLFRLQVQHYQADSNVLAGHFVGWHAHLGVLLETRVEGLFELFSDIGQGRSGPAHPGEEQLRVEIQLKYWLCGHTEPYLNCKQYVCAARPSPYPYRNATVTGLYSCGSIRIRFDAMRCGALGTLALRVIKSIFFTENEEVYIKTRVSRSRTRTSATS